MNKKRIFIISAAILLVLLVGLGTFFIVCAHKNKISFNVEDTLPDGEGKKATVILLGGQSNASGCSQDEYLKLNVSKEKYEEYEKGYDNVYINYYVSDLNISKGFVKCGARQGEAATEQSAYFGPELGLAEKLHEACPDENFFIIKCAWGGTNLFDQWRAPSSSGKTGKMYRTFEAFVMSSVKYLEDKNYDVEIAGMCWMQGESDSFSTDHATDYKENLADFISDIRKKFDRYAAPKGIAFVDALIADNPEYWVYCDMVNASKAEVEKLSELNVLVDTSDLSCSEEPEESPDKAHYDSMSEIKLGNMFAEEIIKFLG